MGAIKNRLWRYTARGTDSDGARHDAIVEVYGPTRQLALWNGREKAFGHWIIRPEWVRVETVGTIRQNTGA